MSYTESEKIELKASFGEWKEIIFTLGAFANKKGGTVVVGLSDSGEPLGQLVGKNTIEDFVNKLKNNSDPVLYPSIVVKTHGIGEIVEISIPESDNKPVYTFDKAYIRVGKTNQKLSSQEVKELVKKYELADFDQQIIKLPVEKNSFERAYIALFKPQPIYAEYLCFAKKNQIFPNAIVKAARFKGSDMAIFIANQDFNSGLLKITDQLIEFIKKNSNKRFVITEEAKHSEKWDYPLLALREAILNALVHRDYSDPGNIQIRIFDNHIEIWSPGTLPKLLDIKRIFFESRSIPRNKNIVSIFHNMGQIEQWGSGFQRMLYSCRENGNPSPQIKEAAGAFVVTFFRNEGTNEGINEGINEGANEGINEGTNEGINKLTDLIKTNPGMRLNSISKILKLPPKTVERWLKKLKDNMVIEFRGSNKTGGYYFIG